MKKLAIFAISTILSGCVSDSFLIEKRCESLYKSGTEEFNDCVAKELHEIRTESLRQEQSSDHFLPNTVVPGVN